MSTPSSIHWGSTDDRDREATVYGLACILSMFICIGLTSLGCDQASEHIIFVSLDAYDPYPYLNAELEASDAAATTLWMARQVVLESQVAARYEARAAEYMTFLESSAHPNIVRKPRPIPEVTLTRPVDINRADAAELQLLPRVGPAMSARIIGGRPYARTSDLLRVRGIGPRTMEQLAPWIVVGGP